MRLIDADALKTVLCASKCGVIDPATCKCGCMDVMCIDNAPTIEAAPVRHGHWEKPQPDGIVSYHPEAYAQCFNCKKKSEWGWHDKWCRNCGAKMDEVTP